MRNDQEVFADIIEQNKKLIFKVCHTYCKDTTSIDDLAQEITLQLWKAFPSYNKTYKLSTWMYRIALNVAISFYRKERKHNKAAAPLEDSLLILDESDENLRHKQNIAQLYDFIEQLDVFNKSIIVLYLEEFSYKEIGEILGITETNVATKISRIKLKLKTSFNKN